MVAAERFGSEGRFGFRGGVRLRGRDRTRFEVSKGDGERDLQRQPVLARLGGAGAVLGT